MIRYSMTFGVMPTRAQFDECWEREVVGQFAFGNDERVGTCELSQDELWEELNAAHSQWVETTEDDEWEETGSWMSSVLYCLGIEWI